MAIDECIGKSIMVEPGSAWITYLEQKYAIHINTIPENYGIAQFLADEKAAAVIRPSRDGKNCGGSGETIFDDNGAALGRTPYKRESAVKVPVVVMAGATPMVGK